MATTSTNRAPLQASRRLPPRLLALVAVLALLLPLYGLLLDHHFAERLPTHLHLYLAGASVQHTHPYWVSHSHGEWLAAPRTVETASSSQGIIFLPPDEQGSPSTLAVGFGEALLTTAVTLLIPTVLMLLAPFGQSALRDFLARLEPPPPRLAL